MANNFLTPSVIAREALALLQSNILTPFLTSRRYEADFSKNGEKVGAQINIRRRSPGVVQEFDPAANGGLGNGNDQVAVHETSIPMILEKHFDAGIEVTARDYTLELEDFSEQILKPHIVEMAEKIDAYTLGKLLHIPNFAGISEVTPAALPAGISDMAQVEKTANDLKFPSRPRYQIISSEYKATLLGVPSFVEVDKSGQDSALRLAQFGPIMGFNSFMGQNTPTAQHTTGTQTTFVVNGAQAPGSTTLVIDTGATAAGTFVANDVLVIAGYGNVTVKSATGFAGAGGAGTATITLQEPLRSIGGATNATIAIADNAAGHVYGNTNAAGAALVGGANVRECHGAIFNPDCIAFAAVPLALPRSVPSEYIQDPVTGLGIRVVYDYNRQAKADVINLDLLCGAVIADPRLGAQIPKFIS